MSTRNQLEDVAASIGEFGVDISQTSEHQELVLQTADRLRETLIFPHFRNLELYLRENGVPASLTQISAEGTAVILEAGLPARFVLSAYSLGLPRYCGENLRLHDRSD